MSLKAIILSPHFDDAVLSCWHVLAGPDEVLVVNVFAGEPPAGTLGPWDRLAGASDSPAAVRTRIEEDRQALALAGRTAVNLPFLDGQYRPLEQSLKDIVEALRGILVVGARLYAPASLGHHHSDHAAVRAAALALHAEGAEVALYADLPHATVSGWPRWVLDGAASRPADRASADRAGADRAGEQWASELQSAGIPAERMLGAPHRLTAQEYASKLVAVRTYASQIAPLKRLYGPLEDPQMLGIEVDWRLGLMA